MVASPFSRAARKIQREVYGEPEIQGKHDCPSCECWFFTRVDLNLHVETHWLLAKNGRGWWMPCKNNAFLTGQIRHTGPVDLNGYRYSLIDNKVLYRTKIEKPRF